jgi:hypothetical protein
MIDKKTSWRTKRKKENKKWFPTYSADAEKKTINDT